MDVLGACWLFDALDIGAIFCSPLNVGSGFVKTSHGVLPVPPPAVAELLKGVPVYSAGPEEELVTPTGAAIVSTLAREFIRFPEITYGRVGSGAGSRELPGLPNILRAFYGEERAFDPAKKVRVIETTVDDATPQVLARFLDRALELGALDAFLTPVVMKKGRLATKLTLLADADRMEDLIEAVFRETSSIGVRFYPVERRILASGVPQGAGPRRGDRDQGVPPGRRGRHHPAGIRGLPEGLREDPPSAQGSHPSRREGVRRPRPDGGSGQGVMMDLKKIEKGVRLILEGVGEDPERPGIKDTPRRVAQMLQETLGGSVKEAARDLRVIEGEKHDEMVLIKNIPLYSMCEHHLLPFAGVAHVAYIPKGGRIVGLSKIARVVDTLARRLQVQERLTKQIADLIDERLKPLGVMVVIEAEHMCMSMRGAKKPKAITVTSAVRGSFRKNAATRAEAMMLIRGGLTSGKEF